MRDPLELLDEKGQIRQDKLDDLLVEVISGRYLFTLSEPPQTLYASRCPTAAEHDRGRIVYARRLREAQSAGLMLKADLEKLALERGLFNPNERNEKLNLSDMMLRQIRARDKSQDATQKAALSVDIEVARKRLVEIEMDEWKVLQHSAESKAEEGRTSYFVSCCTMGGEMLDEPVWSDFQSYLGAADWLLTHDARAAFVRVSNGLPVKVIRALARTNEWRIRWKGSKESRTPPFEGASTQWDKNKVNLIYWSDFYDNIYQHPECPDDDTVNNDEWLQGWLNGQMAKRDKNRAANPGMGGRRTPTYLDGSGKRKAMTKLGADKTINVGMPYKVRV